MSNYRGDRFNGAGYYDPTAYNAIRCVTRNECRSNTGGRAAKLPSPPKVYIASPYRGDTEANVQNAISYCHFAVGEGYMPIAPHIWLPHFLDDDNPRERAMALRVGLWLVTQCSEVWVFGDIISAGMKGEIEAARRCRKPIRYFTDKCKEVF